MSGGQADQLTQGISNAMAAGDMPAVAALIAVLASVDPHRAQLVLDVINLVKQGEA